MSVPVPVHICISILLTIFYSYLSAQDFTNRMKFSLAIQQPPHHPMTVPSLPDTGLPKTDLLEEKR
jgi:hypothetical protein